MYYVRRILLANDIIDSFADGSSMIQGLAVFSSLAMS